METRQEKIEKLKAQAYVYSLNAKSYQELSEEIEQAKQNYKNHSIRRAQLEGQLVRLEFATPTEETIHQKEILKIKIESHKDLQEVFASALKAYKVLLDSIKPGFDKYCELVAKIKKLEAPTVVDKAKSLLAKATSKKKQADAPANDEQAVSETPETENTTLPVGEEPTEPGE